MSTQHAIHLPKVSIQTEDFDLSTEVASLRMDHGDTGAVVSFVGLVRGRRGAQPILAMELEHYPGMTERAIQEMMDAAMDRFQLNAIRIIHRVGVLKAGEQIVLVAVASSHRANAFQACDYLMDSLKTRAPFWKKEITAEGAHWVDAKDSDEQSLSRWKRNEDADLPLISPHL